VDTVYTTPNKKRNCRSLLMSRDRTMLSGIAVQHAVDSYSRRGNFGASLDCGIVLIYSPNDANV